jgi:hypothetical protein
MKAMAFLLSGMLILSGAVIASASPYATEVVDYSGKFGNSPYNDPYSVLGKPSTVFKNSGFSTSTGVVKMVEPAYNVSPDGEKLITTLNSGAYITVAFDHDVYDDPANPYGIDFLVFGNAFFVGSGFVSDSTDASTYKITSGSVFAEPVTVSVSQDGVNWYTYSSGPYADSYFPTQAYAWNQDLYDSAGNGWTDEEMDFTKPVDPSLTASDFAGLTLAEALELYDGSGGGTGFDLAESGFEWIRYIKVTGYGGEIDAFADVAPVPIPGAIWLLGGGLLGIFKMRGKKA